MFCSTVVVLWISSPAAWAVALPLAGQVVNRRSNNGISLLEELLGDASRGSKTERCL